MCCWQAEAGQGQPSEQKGSCHEPQCSYPKLETYAGFCLFLLMRHVSSMGNVAAATLISINERIIASTGRPEF
jgi:hypothetical protein